MVSESRTGGNRVMGPDDEEEQRKVIESIKEIVGNHSDADIYTALKESNMSADEAVQKLIHQGLLCHHKKCLCTMMLDWLYKSSDFFWYLILKVILFAGLFVQIHFTR